MLACNGGQRIKVKAYFVFFIGMLCHCGWQKCIPETSLFFRRCHGNELGAGKVYALEANPEAAASARNTVEKMGLMDPSKAADFKFRIRGRGKSGKQRIMIKDVTVRGFA